MSELVEVDQGCLTPTPQVASRVCGDSSLATKFTPGIGWDVASGSLAALREAEVIGNFDDEPRLFHTQ